MAKDAGRDLERFLDERIAAGELPGAVYAVDGPDGPIARGARGLRAVEPVAEEATLDTIYDLASLTKPLSTAALAALLIRDGRMAPGDAAGRWLPELAGTDKDALTVSRLACHSAGLPAWLPLYVRASTPEGYIRLIGEAPLESPPGRRAVYSCSGYILLGEIVSRAGEERLDAMFRRRIAGPLGLSATGFLPPEAERGRIAPTERDCATEREMVGRLGLRYDGWRPGVIRGQVHDGNAWGLGGVAGNAGLFGAMEEIVRLAREFLGRGGGLFGPAERDLFSRAAITEGEMRTFGWQMAASPGSAAHGALPPASFGHTGFTGTSLWLDPEAGRSYLLLCNRIHPSNRGTDMNALRREFHRLAARVH